MKNFIFFVLFFCSFPMEAEMFSDSIEVQTIDSISAQINSRSVDSLSQRHAPQLYPAWTLYVPGGTHFYDKRYAEGLIFSGLTLGGITYGAINANKFSSENGSPYSNFPLLIGLQAFNVDKCDYFRNQLEYIQYKNPDFRYDKLSYNQLLKAPFQPKNVFTPITGAFVAVALAELFFSGPKPNRYFPEVNRMMLQDKFISKNQALAVYGATSLAASYGAGVAEEYVFRNGVLPIMDYKYGQKKGLFFSSLTFGAMHFSNLLFAQKPDYAGTLLQVLEASVAGYFLGMDVQNRGYKIGPAVAAHMWYDFTLMLGSFLINPQNNFLGVSVQFKM